MLEHYEGTEKLLEVWFRPISSGDIKRQKSDLRDIPKTEWISVLNIVKCEIVGEMEDENQHAYILSESSMFVSTYRFILKTCGTTLLLEALDDLFQLAKKYCHFEVEDIFYSRKNFLRPDLQSTPYKDFQREVEQLDKLFDCGAAYVLGRMNGDCWYLYTLDRNNVVQQPDQTLEILMTELDPSVMKLFQDTGTKDGKDVTKESGIADILPEAKIHEKLFEPCGYSMNGLLPNNGYMTIHVTPEEEYSYVSFESNVEMDNYSDLVQKVIQTFNPGKFVMTLFANSFAKCGSSFSALKETFLNDYRRQDRQYSQFKCYDLTFGHYVQERMDTAKK
ncbi:S-adenosylmethionine decarboxylase proenzyme [Holothuria leucospilota]|uniref:S-adenosylmethionine decarboxylase proenzyme n=1 Tax=Holothuria leucospilota TaxID=206669 RepID=A0A9Q1GXK8_HOLLE|nr:S-adenosylmethionine decarboxylase proenzyme [Holothuria leucospilota]